MKLVMNFCMNFGLNFCMDTCLVVLNTYFCVESLFGMVVVLNGGKNCIEKMLGLGKMLSVFFKPIFFFWS